MSRDGANHYDQYRSNSYLPEAEGLKNGYSLDAGSAMNKNAPNSVNSKYALAQIDQPSKHLASIKSGGSRGSYGQQSGLGRESNKYERS